MKPYPVAEVLLAPMLPVTMPRALEKIKFLQTNGCPLLLQTGPTIP